MSATLTIERMPAVSPDARLYVVDCPHGTTEGLVLPTAGPPVPASAIVRTLLLSHDAAEGCACTRRLWRRYGSPAAATRGNSR